MSNAGAGADLTNVTLTFSDSAGSLLPDASQIFSGTFKPTAYGIASWPAPAPAGPYDTNLAAFQATAPNGTWSLYVIDDAFQDSGNIAGGWLLNLITATNLPPILTNLTVTPVIPENGIATLAGTILDPNADDSFTLSVNWGDTVANENFSLPPGATNFFVTHRYLDDGQTGTPSDNYPVAVTVTDSAGVSDQNFLSALFQDLLARPFDLTLLAYYQNQIAQLGLSGTVSQLLGGLEYRSRKTRDYFQQFLHRDANPGEQNFYASSPLTERDFASSILGSGEYFNVRAGGNNANWVTAVFYDLLKRRPSVVDNNFYLGLIAQNGRASAADALLGSLEFRQVLVESWFQRFLHRAGGPSVGPFVSALAVQTWEQVMSAIIGSTEYYNVRSGGTASAALSVTVTNVPPIMSNVSAASPILEGGITSVSGQITDPGSQDSFLLQIDWADGSPVQTVALTNGATFFNVPHLFSTPHTTNLVQLTLTDDDGGVASQNLPIVVLERAPKIISIQRQPGSITRLDCLGVPARTYTLQGSTNLFAQASWTNIGQVTAAPDGTFTAYDMPPSNLPQRFYRLSHP
jgi:hypothetical protein